MTPLPHLSNSRRTANRVSCEYSEELLRRELELFPEWYVKRHLNMEITPQMRSMFDKMFDLIIKKNLAQSFVYVHRDYMPRNLMLEEKDNPGVIDFQDAVYGPVSYDIACLCRDAFISWSEAQVLDWTIRYWDKARKVGIPVPRLRRVLGRRRMDGSPASPQGFGYLCPPQLPRRKNEIPR